MTNLREVVVEEGVAWRVGGAVLSTLQPTRFCSWLRGSGEGPAVQLRGEAAALERESPQEKLGPWSEDVPGWMACHSEGQVKSPSLTLLFSSPCPASPLNRPRLSWVSPVDAAVLPGWRAGKLPSVTAAQGPKNRDRFGVTLTDTLEIS